MKFFSLLILLLFFCGCGTAPTYTSSEKERLCNEVTKIAIKKICSESKLIPCGTGGGALNQIRMLAISFNYYQDVNIAEGRKLLIQTVETFLSIINADERIRPYLIKYPFDPENIEIRIFIFNKDGSSIGSDRLCVIGIIDGILDYQIHTPDGLWLERVHEETYEEALEKLKERHTSSTPVAPTKNELYCAPSGFSY